MNSFINCENVTIIKLRRTRMANEKTTTSDLVQCVYLREFRAFLHQLANETAASATDVRCCMTRSNNETYPIAEGDEFNAELVMAIWTQLAKQCPRYFQIPLLHAVVDAYQNVKECDFLYVGKREETAKELLEQASQYDLIKLRKYAVNSLGKFLMRLTDNAEAGNLKNYADPGTLCQSQTQCYCKNKTFTPAFISGYIKNKPRKMEDCHVCLDRYGSMYKLKRLYSFYGVFDGHSGPLAAKYVASQLPYALALQLQQIDAKLDVVEADGTLYREAFESAFLEIDKIFAAKRISSGTTAVCALLCHNKPVSLYVAWVGDSKALLVNASAYLQLVKAHKPDAAEERKRIEMSGGSVLYVQGQWRVNGILNVSRSIGDYTVNAVIAEPDFVDIQLTCAHDFLLLATDGLWDYVAEEIIVKTIYKALADVEQNIEDIPKSLIELAKAGESQDNITVVIVLLRERNEIVENYKTIA